MKNMFKIFKKKVKDIVKPKPPLRITINNREHVIEDSVFISVQSCAEDIQVYGWSLESRYQYSNGEWMPWHIYYNNKIYHSRETAIDAGIKSGLCNSSTCERRVVALYKMNEPQYRDYKIDKILGNSDKNRKTYEIKGWKLKEDYEYNRNSNRVFIHKKGSIFIQLENGGIIKSGSYLDPSYAIGRSRLEEMITKGVVEEINITDEKWLHPHLLKELKVKLKIK